MKRFQDDLPVMLRRLRFEYAKHSKDGLDCPCLQGPGTMRKHRPDESHSSGNCSLCRWERDAKRRTKRKERRIARAVALDEITA